MEWKFNNNTLVIAYTDVANITEAQALATQLGLPCSELSQVASGCALVLTPEGLDLRLLGKGAPGPIMVDFLSGAVAHRYHYGGGRGQLIARAVGLQRHATLSILDLTAGLGRDAFVLASLGCDVTMVERSPIVAALLRDGLQRGQKENWFAQLALRCVESEAVTYLHQLAPSDYPDVIYLDPMYPDLKKSALAKKEMRVLRYVVGDDHDADHLLQQTLPCAKRRVVVKRARLAPTLVGPKPDVVFNAKSSRYDV